GDGGLAVVDMDEVEERPAQEVALRPAQVDGPGRIDAQEASVGIEDAEQVEGEGEEAFDLGLELAVLVEVGADEAVAQGLAVVGVEGRAEEAYRSRLGLGQQAPFAGRDPAGVQA